MKLEVAHVAVSEASFHLSTRLYVYLSDITHKLMNEVPGERFTAVLFNL